jgi:hypothetical protein
VSKRHARVYEKGGVWYLVDVGSSNGTYMQGKRLTGPVVLQEGSVFGMSRHKFKVTTMGGAAADDDEPLFPDQDLPPPGLPEDSIQANPPLPDPSPPPDLEPSYPPQQQGMNPTDPPMPPHTEMAHDGGHDMGGDEIEAKGVGYFFVAVPKAIGFYMAKVPLLAFNPMGTVRKSIEEQPHAAMGKMELIAYALPAQIFAGMFGAICTGIGLLIGGAGFSLMSFIPIPAIIGAVIGSIIIGLIFHPVLGWFVRILKGSSDARSRSNYFLIMMTVAALVAVGPC